MKGTSAGCQFQWLKNRRVKDILIICADGMIGINEAIGTAYPKIEYQRCIVCWMCNTVKHLVDQERKVFCADLKKNYQALIKEELLDALEKVTKR